jgi:hypothetical protein
MTTFQPISSDMTPAQRNVARAANFAHFASNMRAWAARLEARAPGRMDHVVLPVLEAAVAADRVSAAYASGDKEAVLAARVAFAFLAPMGSNAAHAMD